MIKKYLTCEDCFKDCKGECCRGVYLTYGFIQKHIDKLQTKIYTYSIRKQDLHKYIGKQCLSENSNVVAVTNIKGIDKNGEVCIEKQPCPFLTSEHHCAIYDERPTICRLYGTIHNSKVSLTCFRHLGKPWSFPPKGTNLRSFFDSPAGAEFNAKWLLENKPEFIEEIRKLENII